MNLDKESERKIKNTQYNLHYLKEKYDFYANAFKYKLTLQERNKLNKKFMKNLCKEYCKGNQSYIDEMDNILLPMSWKWVKNTIPSLIAPAYNYNLFIDNLLEYIKKCDGHVFAITEEFIFYIISAQNLLVSIKSAIDKIVGFFRIFYDGFSKETTFGHINDSGKYTGFLNYAFSSNKKDSILNYVLKSYNRWIKEVVELRDSVMHYEDLTFGFSGGYQINVVMPVAFAKKYPYKIDFCVLKNYLTDFYRFINHILDYFLFESDKSFNCDYYGKIIDYNEFKIINVDYSSRMKIYDLTNELFEVDRETRNKILIEIFKKANDKNKFYCIERILFVSKNIPQELQPWIDAKKLNKYIVNYKTYKNYLLENKI